MSTNSEAPWPLIPIANTPIPADANADLTKWFSIDMSLAHNLMIRAINSLWRNAPLVVPEDEIAFAGYGLTCMQVIGEHHHAEETIVFPRLQKKLDMGHNIEQHEAFQGPMEELKLYFTRIIAREEAHDAEKTRSLVKAFAEPLVVHLTEELDTITPERMSVFSQEELAETNKALDDHLKALGGFFTILPFGITAHDKTQAPYWPPVPKPIRWFGMNIGYFVNRGYWKFAPFARDGSPQSYSGRD